MPTIAALLDTWEGHTLPTLGLLRCLKARGHRIACLGMPAIEDAVLQQGFEFIPILGNVWRRESLLGNGQKSYRLDDLPDLYFGPLVRGQVLDAVVAALKA